MSSISMQSVSMPGWERPEGRLEMAYAALPLAGLVLALVLSAGSGHAGSCGGIAPDQYVMALPPAPVVAG